jgi:hypothetical protein
LVDLGDVDTADDLRALPLHQRLLHQVENSGARIGLSEQLSHDPDAGPAQPVLVEELQIAVGSLFPGSPL